MLRFLAPALGILLIVAAGVINGQKTDRWGIAAKVEAAAARLEQIPPAFGNWYSTEVDISKYQLQQAEAIGHLSRRYVNRSSGLSVNVMILCGRHGPISVHPPTVCFTGAGWRLDAPQKPRKLKPNNDSPAHTFWQADFVKSDDGIPERQRTYWGWTTDGSWRAEERPRLSFAGAPYLYKMYVTHAVREAPEATQSPGQDNDDQDPAVDFMREFLPILRNAVFENRRSQ